MVLRQAQKGPSPGEKFWGCSRFPVCRQTVSADAATKDATSHSHLVPSVTLSGSIAVDAQDTSQTRTAFATARVLEERVLEPFVEQYRPIWPFVAASAALLLALADMPWGYFSLLRFGVAAACVYAAVSGRAARPIGRYVLFGLLALGMLGVRQSREDWAVTDLALSALFLLLAAQYRVSDWLHCRKLRRTGARLSP